MYGRIRAGFVNMIWLLLKGTIRKTDVLEVMLLFFSELDPSLSRNN